MTLAEPPGAIDPVAKDLLSAVALWVAVSLFFYVTVVPTATFSGLGENAVVVRANAPLTIDALAVTPVGVGLGVGVGVVDGVELLLHAARQHPAKSIRPNRNDMSVASCGIKRQTPGHPIERDLWTFEVKEP